MHRELEYLGSDLAGGVARGWAGVKTAVCSKTSRVLGCTDASPAAPPPWQPHTSKRRYETGGLWVPLGLLEVQDISDRRGPPTGRDMHRRATAPTSEAVRPAATCTKSDL